MTRKEWDKKFNYGIYAKCEYCVYFTKGKLLLDPSHCRLMKESGVTKGYSIVDAHGCCNRFTDRHPEWWREFLEPTKELMPALALTV